MATKEQVLPLLKLGLTPQQIAKKLKCLPSYVRAVKAREFGNGREVQRRYDLAHKADKHRWFIENRDRWNEYQRRYRARKAEQSQSAN